jgi:hypothetical protein
MCDDTARATNSLPVDHAMHGLHAPPHVDRADPVGADHDGPDVAAQPGDGPDASPPPSPSIPSHGMAPGDEGSAASSRGYSPPAASPTVDAASPIHPLVQKTLPPASLNRTHRW